MVGFHFDLCDEFLFEVSFEKTILDLSSFYKRKLKNTSFNKCSLREIDFSEADLAGAVLNDCDLSKTLFENTILDKADLRTAFGYSINPELNSIKKTKFSIPGVIGLLDKYDIEIS
jgi:uncharacterized protein YjbI with pentapeptide repeats